MMQYQLQHALLAGERGLHYLDGRSQESALHTQLKEHALAASSSLWSAI